MDYFKQNLKIKHLSFPRFIGGPLDGITDSPFRKLVRDFSKEELLYTEMRHVCSVVTPKGGAMALDFSQYERPLNFQVSANSPEHVKAACEKIVQAGVDMIDLNVGCPARNVVTSCCGSALMANPVMLEKILKEFKRVIPDHVPFTIKIRSGFKQVNAVDIAKLAQDCGVDALAIHPRLQPQMFTGLPDYKVAAAVKQAVSIPVIFSGNVVNFKTAKMTYEATGVDGFLIGRGIWAKPWKLEEMKQHAMGNEYVVDQSMILQVALRHLSLMVEQFGVHGLLRFRKHLPFYIKGHPSASALRSRLVRSESEADIKEGLQEFLS
ncbi:MAG: tRNA-dihydrouridine synthase [Candidatus Dependentiae bacterium]|nr:tRNA-dihydrouridine synthase [Candidatus Dependentiae bacterium]